MHVPATIPYTWPYDGSLDPTSLAVVVCGAQAGIIKGALGAPAVAETIAGVTDAIRELGGLVVWVRHGPTTSSRRPTPLPLRWTTAWTPTVAAEIGDRIVDAAGWDGCYSSDLEHVLRSGGRSHVVLAGFASELTVDSTVRALNDRGFECLVLTDACAPLDAELGARAHASLTMSGGIFGALGLCTDLLDAVAHLPRPEPSATGLRAGTT